MTDSSVQPKALLALLVLAALLAVIAIPRLSLTYDLGFFLPSPTNEQQSLLVERLGQGPGTQLLFVTLHNTTVTDAEHLAQTLRQRPEIARVLPENKPLTAASIPTAIWDNRFYLSDLPKDETAWSVELEERLMDTMLADDALLDIIARDPALSSVKALEHAISLTSQPNFGDETQRHLLIQTAQGAFDIDAQRAAVDGIRQTLSSLGHNNAELLGSGVYGVDLQASVQRESILFSSLASAALAAVLLVRFRKLSLALAAGVPLIVGGLAGVCALALAFDQVHGITLAFGFTLLGVAIDYPLHLMAHAKADHQHHAQGVRSTLMLGVASTLIAYLAFVLSGTSGMQQLGVFAFTGLFAAAAAALFLVSRPDSGQPPQTQPTHSDTRSQLLQWPWLCALLVGAVLLYNKPLFSNDLSQMTPVPRATLAKDSAVRANLGVADLRYLFSVRQPDLETTLTTLETLTGSLERQIQNGKLQGYQSISALLPSYARQQNRQKSLQGMIETRAFESALNESEFEPALFAPYQAELLSAATRDLNNNRLSLESLRGQHSELDPLIDSLLYRSGDSWVALVFLRGLSVADEHTLAQLSELSKGTPGVAFVDLKDASMTLVDSYRSQVLKILGGALLAIALVLLVVTRHPPRVLWLLGTLSAALTLSLAAGVQFLGTLSLFDTIALALVAGLGLDYALFFSKSHHSVTARNTTASAVGLCALSSALVFGILAISDVPILRGLGVTVAAGVVAAYLLARFGQRKAPETSA